MSTETFEPQRHSRAHWPRFSCDRRSARDRGAGRSDPPSSAPSATPGVTPGAGVAPARRDSKCEPLRAQNQDRSRRNVLHVRAGIPPTKTEVIVASSMGPIGPTRRDVDAGILPGLLHFAWVHLGKWQPSVRMLDIATDFRASAQLQRSRAGGALGDSLTLRELTHFERVDWGTRSSWIGRFHGGKLRRV